MAVESHHKHLMWWALGSVDGVYQCRNGTQTLNNIPEETDLLHHEFPVIWWHLQVCAFSSKTWWSHYSWDTTCKVMSKALFCSVRWCQIRHSDQIFEEDSQHTWHASHNTEERVKRGRGSILHSLVHRRQRRSHQDNLRDTHSPSPAVKTNLSNNWQKHHKSVFESKSERLRRRFNKIQKFQLNSPSSKGRSEQRKQNKHFILRLCIRLVYCCILDMPQLH